ncbi:MAG: hypothetical protein ABWY63_00950 [Hyphomicrobiaceae bacterium]
MMGVVRVHQTWTEVWEAAYAGLMRHLDNRRNGRRDRYGAEQDAAIGSEWHIMGAIGEQAVCKWRGTEWRPMAFGIIDAGDCEVRATNAHYKRLVVHREDRDDVPFILAHVVPGELPTVTLTGWLLGRDAKREEWWGEANPAKPNGRPAYWVPNDALRGLAELT